MKTLLSASLVMVGLVSLVRADFAPFDPNGHSITFSFENDFSPQFDFIDDSTIRFSNDSSNPNAKIDWGLYTWLKTGPDTAIILMGENFRVELTFNSGSGGSVVYPAEDDIFGEPQTSDGTFRYRAFDWDAPKSLNGIKATVTITAGEGVFEESGSYRIEFTENNYTITSLVGSTGDESGRYAEWLLEARVINFNLYEVFPDVTLKATAYFASNDGVVVVSAYDSSDTKVGRQQGNFYYIFTDPTPPESMKLTGWLFADRYPYVYSHANGKWFYFLPNEEGLWVSDMVTGDWYLVE